MKTLKLTVAILFLASLAFAQANPEKWAIKGKAISSTEEGVLVLCISDGSFGRPKPPDESIVFVRGLEAADDDPVSVEAYPAGMFHYDSAGGAAKTVRAFALELPKE